MGLKIFMLAHPQKLFFLSSSLPQNKTKQNKTKKTHTKKKSPMAREAD